MNIQESLKNKFNLKYNKLVDALLKETQKDFDAIWDEFIGEAKKKKEELLREGFSLQERNKLLKLESGELEIINSNLTKDKNIISKEIYDYDKQLSELNNIRKENEERGKRLDEIEAKQTEERIEIGISRDKMKAEMILLNDKQNSLKRAYNIIEKNG